MMTVIFFAHQAAWDAGIVVVAAVSKDVIAQLSSRDPTIDGQITSLQADIGYLPKEKSSSGGKSKAAKASALGKPSKTTSTQPYCTMSGTSMATHLI